MGTQIAKVYDLLVIGGGSGGLACARRAAKHGASVAIIESAQYLGGTCVNLGCVPKKIMWYAADVGQKMKDANAYSHSFGSTPSTTAETHSFSWSEFKSTRDLYIRHLNTIYEKNIADDKVEWIAGHAAFCGQKELLVTMPNGSADVYTSEHILISAGGTPHRPDSIPGQQLGIDSDGFFDLKEQPKRVLIVGAGYIAVELAGIFNALGSETHIFLRHNDLLRTFDHMIQEALMNEYETAGITIHRQTSVVSVERNGHDLRVFLKTNGVSNKDLFLDVDTLIWAVGRKPNTRDLHLSKCGVEVNANGEISVNEYQDTNIHGVYALGDVTGKLQLTPVAVAAGRKLADRLFGGLSDAKLDYKFVPSVVFAHPEIGTVGYTEHDARAEFGHNNITVYENQSVSLYFAPLKHKLLSRFKLVCQGTNEKIIGLHIMGPTSSEMLQGFGVAIKMGATKQDFDACVAVHPTAAEELVTMT